MFYANECENQRLRQNGCQKKYKRKFPNDFNCAERICPYKIDKNNEYEIRHKLRDKFHKEGNDMIYLLNGFCNRRCPLSEEY